MNSRLIIPVIISFFVYLLTQTLLLKNFVLFDTAFCFLYIGFILMLPVEIGPLLLMVIAFSMGLGVDLFYDSIGVNAAASVFMAFLRPYWLKVITPRGGYEDVVIPSLKSVDIGWFFTYSLPLIFLHHFALLYIETGGFDMFFFTLVKVFFSTLLTFFILVLSQYLFYKKTT